MASIAAFSLTTRGVLYMHNYLLGFFLLIFVMYTWWRYVVREATLEEQHNFAVQRGLRLGMILLFVYNIGEMYFLLLFLEWALHL